MENNIHGVLQYIMAFPSVYDMTNASMTTVRKQHFWEYFSGSTLNSRWSLNGSNVGTGMNDEVDGGYSVMSAASGYNKTSIYFANKCQYSPTESVFIANAKFSRTNDGTWGLIGLSDDGSDNSQRAYIGKMDSAQSTNFGAWTSNASGAYINTSGTIAQDTSYHIFKGVLGSSKFLGSIDGTLNTTSTGVSHYLPTASLQPTILSMANAANPSISVTVNYFEVYNT
jgi:hypothetical protein